MGTMDRDEDFYIKAKPSAPSKNTPEEDKKDLEYVMAFFSRAIIQSRLKKMTDADRVLFFRALTEGYCEACGREENRSAWDFCQCENDE